MKLLSLNGGGTCGYMTACLLSNIEKELGHPSHVLFDLMTGVSTGSIICAFLAQGTPACEIKELYKQLASDIFAKKCWIPWRPWYSLDKLHTISDKYLLVPFNKSKTKTMIYATKINDPGFIKPKFWKSWKEDDTVTSNELVVSSCAAPVYFAPHEYNGDVYIDGGFVGNNPTMHCISEALVGKACIDTLYNLNIGCGREKGFDNATKYVNIFKWLPKLPTLAIRAGELTSEYHAHQLIGFRNHSVQPEADMAMDTLDFGEMESEAGKMWELHKQEIINQLSIT